MFSFGHCGCYRYTVFMIRAIQFQLYTQLQWLFSMFLVTCYYIGIIITIINLKRTCQFKTHCKGKKDHDLCRLVCLCIALTPCLKLTLLQRNLVGMDSVVTKICRFICYASLWPPYVIGQAMYIFILWFLLLLQTDMCQSQTHNDS